MSRIAPLIGLTLLLACGSEEPASPDPDDNRGETIRVIASEVFGVTLQTIGPGEYASPPLISSPAVRFLQVTLLEPVPAGPTQRFRFQAVQSGRAVITFRHTGQGPTIQDTVEVE